MGPSLSVPDYTLEEPGKPFSPNMIDRHGYRLNVGIVLCNDEQRVFWARRVGMRSWQFPQGGIKRNEDPEAAMYRELYEEVGLTREDVQLVARTSEWLHYDLPVRYIRKRSYPLCIGQKQLWFMLRLVSPESRIRLDCSGKPEFDSWTWVDYWHPIEDVVYFKREVYQRALSELSNHLILSHKLSEGLGLCLSSGKP